MKWKYWEHLGDARQRADEVVDWLLARDMKVRGHTMVWQCANFGVTYPKDIESRLEDATDENRARVRTHAREHVKAVGSYYCGQMVHWDVVNEVCGRPPVLLVCRVSQRVQVHSSTLR